MQNYIDTLLIAVVVVYVVDLSGFTQSWRDALARFIGKKELKPIKPFDCGQCMTWWTCIAYNLIFGQLSVAMLAFIALLSFLSVPIGQLLIFIKEALNAVIGKQIDRL